jgi:hypothetical protein
MLSSIAMPTIALPSIAMLSDRSMQTAPQMPDQIQLPTVSMSQSMRQSMRQSMSQSIPAT